MGVMGPNQHCVCQLRDHPDKDANRDEGIHDRENFRKAGCRRKVTVSNRGHSHYTKIQGVNNTPTLVENVEHRTSHLQNEH